jgi:hypothetical protein
MRYLLSLVLFCIHGISVNGPIQIIDKQLIIGRWRDNSDPKSEVVFTKDTEIDYYEKKKVMTLSYRIKGDSLIGYDKSDSDYYYYTIISISKKYLSMTYMGRANIFLYKRE